VIEAQSALNIDHRSRSKAHEPPPPSFTEKLI
jgi:hypothetical protein